MLSWFHLVCMGQKYAIIYMYYSNGNNILYRVRLSPRAIQTWIVISVQCIHMQFPKIALAWTTVNQFLYINTITCPCSHLLVKYRCPNTVLSSTKHFWENMTVSNWLHIFWGLFYYHANTFYTCISKEMFFCICVVALFIETDKCSNLKL